jgi:hypothetical protein
LRVSRHLLSDILLYIFPVKNISNMSSRFPTLYSTNLAEYTTDTSLVTSSTVRSDKSWQPTGYGDWGRSVQLDKMRVFI